MEKMWRWIAWHLPHRVVMWAVIRVGVFATSGRWSSQDVTSLTVMTALQRWETRQKDRGRRQLIENQAMEMSA